MGLWREPNAWVDGKGEYVTLGRVEDFRFDQSRPFTMSFWFKTTGARPGKVEIATPKSRVEVDVSRFNDGLWHHMVVPKCRSRRPNRQA